MSIQHSAKYTIETRTQTILQDTVATVLATARLAILRGPAGIGKSYALETILDQMADSRDTMVMLTASPAIGGSIQKFFSAACEEIASGRVNPNDAMEEFSHFMLNSFPFWKNGQRRIFAVDECQHLKANVLEAIRAVYDRGDRGRKFDPSYPAFGLLLVGNDNFLTRGGRAERMAFEALNTRCPIEWPLDRPTKDEYVQLASRFFPEEAELAGQVARFGIERRNLREMAEAFAVASHFAGDGQCNADHLQRAILMMGGK